MPKKTRKMKQRAAMRRGLQVPPAQSTREVVTAAPVEEPRARMQTPAFGARAVTPLTFDYSHIYKDLKRIALFASFFFAVLIVLSFVIK